MTVFFAVISFSIHAQTTVSGTVTDTELGEPLIGANILIKGTSVGTTADIDGNFSLKSNVPLPWTIEISYTGFTSESIEISGDQTGLAVKLVEGVSIGEEVVVSASRRREKVQEAPASISVLGER